nr:hypothetical protein 19 [bacterium]
MGYSLLGVDAAESRVRQAYNELGIGHKAGDHVKRPDVLVNEVMDYGLSVSAIKDRLRAEYNLTEEAHVEIPQISPEDYAKRQQEAYEKNRPKNAALEYKLFSEYAPKYQDAMDQMLAESRKKAAENEFEIYQEYADKYANAMQQVIEDIYPEQHNLGEVLAIDLKNRMEADSYIVPDNIKNAYRDDVREAWSERGLLYSGASAEEEALSLAGLASDWRMADINTALTLDSRLPDVAPINHVPGDALTPLNSIPGFVPEVNDYFGTALNASLGLYSTDLNAEFRNNDYEFDMMRTKLANDQANNSNFFKDMMGSATQRGIEAFASKAGFEYGDSVGNGKLNPKSNNNTTATKNSPAGIS